MKSKIFTKIMALCTFLILVGIIQVSASAHDHLDFTAWSATNSLPTETGKYYLDSDITLDAATDLADNTTICLNGHSINLNSDYYLEIKKGRTVTLCDCATSQTKGYIDAEGVWHPGDVIDDTTQREFDFTGGVIYNSTRHGVYVYENGAFIMEGGNFAGLSAAQDTGGINSNGNFKMTGGTIAGNNGFSVICTHGNCEISGGTITKNTASGGAVCNYNRKGYLTISGGEIKNNTGNNGTVYNYGTFTMTGGMISDNFAKTGGGVLNDYGTFTMTGGTISNNTAEGGGGVYNYRGGIFKMTDGIISGNSTSTSGNSTSTYGGGVFNINSSLEIIGGTISNNTAGYGGGVCNYNYSTATISGGTFSNNKANMGGGIMNWGATITMTDGIISGNSALYYGGGICNYDNTAILEMSGGILSENVSSYDGGAIYNNGNVKMSGGTISENSALYYGGGICNYGNNAILEMSGGTISNNSTQAYGGGIFNIATFNITGKVNISGNSHNGTDNNVYVYGNSTINISAEQDIPIGILYYSEKSLYFNVTAPSSSDYSGSFKSDDPLHTIVNSGTGDNQIVRILPSKITISEDAVTKTEKGYKYKCTVTSPQNITGTFIMALYGENNRFLECKKITWEETDSVYIQPETEIVTDSAATAYKIIFLDGIDTLKPYCVFADGNITTLN